MNNDSNDSNNSFISEDCFVCGKEMCNIKEIRLLIDEDVYVCMDCVDRFNFIVSDVLDY